MKKDYSIAEARQDLPAIVHEVERNGIARITRRGRAVAYLVSAAELDRLRSRRSEPDWTLLDLDLSGFKFDREEANER